MKTTSQQTVGYTVLVMLALLISSFTLKQIIVKKESKTTKEGFAVLELFTSQGCSSCPPADAVLAKYALQNNPNIIPLAFHVDYWNYIGWKDPFSKAQFSSRQKDYTAVLQSQGSYTPQLVINGQDELVGSNESGVKALVAKALATKKQQSIALNKATLKGSQVEVAFAVEATMPNTVINLALVKREEFTSIKRGENTGLKQTSYNIVFDFKTVPSNSSTESFEFKKEWIAADYFVVAYLQNNKTGAILAASKVEIN